MKKACNDNSVNDFYEFQIGDFWASAIINGDESGLTDDESKMLKAWHDNLPDVDGHIDGFDESDSLGFCIDDITGLFSECYRVRLVFKKEREQA